MGKKELTKKRGKRQAKKFTKDEEEATRVFNEACAKYAGTSSSSSRSFSKSARQVSSDEDEEPTYRRKEFEEFDEESDLIGARMNECLSQLDNGRSSKTTWKQLGKLSAQHQRNERRRDDLAIAELIRQDALMFAD
jgi:hypothetical protein